MGESTAEKKDIEIERECKITITRDDGNH